jgi:hypothetical protein
MSRRDLLKLSLLLCGGAVLAACQHILPPPAPVPTFTPTQTDTPAPLPTLTPRPTQPPTATPLTCVHLLTPENGVTLPAAGRLTFSWEPMPEAAAYWLEIRLPNGQTATFDSTGSRDLYLEAFRMRGVYYWQVSALGHGGGLLCTSDPFVFEKGE